MGMFCFQCQETAMNKGCTIKGVCGKEPATAGLMDVLIYAVRGEAIVNRALRAKAPPTPPPAAGYSTRCSAPSPTPISTTRR